MIKNFCVIVNTNSSYSDLWEMFFKSLETFFPDQKVYVFSDIFTNIDNKYIHVKYDPNDDFRTQFFKSMQSVKEEFCLTLNEDYILYDYVDLQKIDYCLDFLNKIKNCSFVRLTKNFLHPHIQVKENIFYLNNKEKYFFSQTATIWRKDILKKVYENSPNSGISRKGEELQLEELANETCKKMNLSGAYYYNNEEKRGMFHYDSSIFPYIASALVGGKWNLKEYEKELLPILKDYNINYNARGIYK